MKSSSWLFFLIVLILGGSSFSVAQTTRDHILFLMHHSTPTTLNQKVAVDSAKTVISEPGLLGMGLIRIYQEFISSQAKSPCIFSISCSHFAMKAIEQKGFIIGVLLVADRLQRCNGAAREYYEVDPLSGAAIDPILTI